MATSDSDIGRNIQRLRGERSQSAVAESMRGSGWSWAQNTVSQVEKGERPLRLAEAVDLARVLATDVSVLYAPADDTAWISAFNGLERLDDKLFDGLREHLSSVLSVVIDLGDVFVDDQQDRDLIHKAGEDGLVTVLAVWRQFVDETTQLLPHMDISDRARERIEAILDAWREALGSAQGE